MVPGESPSPQRAAITAPSSRPVGAVSLRKLKGRTPPWRSLPTSSDRLRRFHYRSLAPQDPGASQRLKFPNLGPAPRPATNSWRDDCGQRRRRYQVEFVIPRELDEGMPFAPVEPHLVAKHTHL